MRFSKPKTLLFVLTLAAVGALLSLQTRREQVRLRDLQQAIDTLRLKNQQLAAAAKHKPALRKTPGALGEQEKFRAAGLVSEMSARKLRAEAAGFPPRELQPGMTPLSSLSYVGQATPLAAVESSLWAIYHGDIGQLAKGIALTPDGRTAAATLFAGLPPETQAQLQTPEYMMALLVAYGGNAIGYQILRAQPNDSDPTHWTVQSVIQLEDGRTTRPTNVLVENAGAWQIEFNQNAVRQFAIFLTGASQAPLPPPAGR